jgi:hypothetical protein
LDDSRAAELLKGERRLLSEATVNGDHSRWETSRHRLRKRRRPSECIFEVQTEQSVAVQVLNLMQRAVAS